MITLNWFSILLLMDLDAVKEIKTDPSKEKKTYRTDWRSRWILLRAPRVSVRFLGSLLVSRLKTKRKLRE